MFAFTPVNSCPEGFSGQWRPWPHRVLLSSCLEIKPCVLSSRSVLYDTEVDFINRGLVNRLLAGGHPVCAFCLSSLRQTARPRPAYNSSLHCYISQPEWSGERSKGKWVWSRCVLEQSNKVAVSTGLEWALWAYLVFYLAVSVRLGAASLCKSVWGIAGEWHSSNVECVMCLGSVLQWRSYDEAHRALLIQLCEIWPNS